MQSLVPFQLLPAKSSGHTRRQVLGRGRVKQVGTALVEAFIEDLRVHQYSQSSQVQAQRVLPRLFGYLKDQGIHDILSVNEAHLIGFARHLADSTTRRGTPLALWSRSSYLATVRRFFAFLEKRHFVLQNPARHLPLPRAERLPRAVLSEAQAHRLMTAPPPTTVGKRDRAILETFYGTGIRRGELARLDIIDIGLLERTLLVRDGKGKRDRMLPIPGQAAAALDVYLREARPQLVREGRDPALFLSCHGRRLSAVTVGVLVCQYGRATGVGFRVSPHVLRHSYATHLLKGGANIREIQELLGHRCIETTQLYSRVVMQDLREVLARSHPRERRKRR